MLTHSDAYLDLKAKHQNDIEVIILCCHAVPALKAYIKAVDGGEAPKIPDPDYFKVPQPFARLKDIMPRYRKVLGRMLFLASFSHFEAYFKDLIREIMAFHSGKERWLQQVANNAFAAQPVTDNLNKLREKPKPRSHQRYKNAIEGLTNNRSFRFPSEKLAAYGIHCIARNVNDLRSSEIQDMAAFGLGVRISDAQWKKFSAIRERRNTITHQNPLEIELTEAMGTAKFLFDMAKNIDQHVVEHMMIIENV